MLLMLIFFLFIFSFFFFKQKTAYEMRISDWSSDVCSSDLIDRQVDEIWDLGVRELFPYHDINSALGGTGIFNGLTLNLIGFLQTGSSVSRRNATRRRFNSSPERSEEIGRAHV